MLKGNFRENQERDPVITWSCWPQEELSKHEWNKAEREGMSEAPQMVSPNLSGSIQAFLPPIPVTGLYPLLLHLASARNLGSLEKV